MRTLLAITMALAPIPVASAAAPEVAPAESPALPDDPAQRAGVLFDAGRFAEAAAAFQDAFETTGDAVFLFGRAQALRRAGNCGAAIDVLQTFIGTSPPDPDVAEARRVIDACREILGETATAPAPSRAETPLLAPAPSRPTRAAWTRDILGGVLVGTGGFTSVAGVGFFAGAFAMARDREEREAQFEDRARRVRITSGVGIALIAVGGALLVGGVIRYAVVARRTKPVDRVVWRPDLWRF